MRNQYNVRVENKRTTGTMEDRRRGFESMLRSFRRACAETGVSNEFKRREFYEKPSEKRRRKHKERLIEMHRTKSE